MAHMMAVSHLLATSSENVDFMVHGLLKYRGESIRKDQERNQEQSLDICIYLY